MVRQEFSTENGPADYELFVAGKLLGIIEAKKVTINPQNVPEQAKRYAAGVSHGIGHRNGYRVPFLYVFMANSKLQRLNRRLSPASGLATCPVVEMWSWLQRNSDEPDVSAGNGG